MVGSQLADLSICLVIQSTWCNSGASPWIHVVFRRSGSSSPAGDLKVELARHYTRVRSLFTPSLWLHCRLTRVPRRNSSAFQRLAFGTVLVRLYTMGMPFLFLLTSVHAGGMQALFLEYSRSVRGTTQEGASLVDKVVLSSFSIRFYLQSDCRQSVSCPLGSGKPFDHREKALEETLGKKLWESVVLHLLCSLEGTPALSANHTLPDPRQCEECKGYCGAFER